MYSALNWKYQAQNNLNQLYQQKMRMMGQPSFGFSGVAQPAVPLNAALNNLHAQLKQDVFIPSQQAPAANPAALTAIDQAIEAAKLMLKMAMNLYEEAVKRIKEELDQNHRIAMAWHEPSDKKK